MPEIIADLLMDEKRVPNKGKILRPVIERNQQMRIIRRPGKLRLAGRSSPGVSALSRIFFQVWTKLGTEPNRVLSRPSAVLKS